MLVKTPTKKKEQILKQLGTLKLDTPNVSGGKITIICRISVIS